jgi:carbon-monoxide dehydrogenase small subunit
MDSREITVTINGESYERDVAPRRLLSDFIRHDAGLSGTNVGCEHGACGMCTVLLDGETVRSCLTFAVQADGAEIETVENLGSVDDLHPLQEAFHENHGLQCGYCTPGMLMSAKELLAENPDPTREEIRERMSSVLCRCTGYQPIIDSVQAAAELVDDADRPVAGDD